MVLGVITASMLLAIPLAKAYAQVTPITPSGLGTQISAPIAVGGQIQFNIIGGTRPDGGLNLFHSFGDFNVPTSNIANFLNETALPTSNILGRVTGGNPSSIFGTIQTEGFSNANLFLMNPAGILFGPNATLDVRGAVTFTTANYLRLGEVGVADAGIFHADSALANVLTSAPVAAFGFLSSNPTAISVQGSTLTVAPGQSISLVGGNSGFEYTDPDTGLTASTPVPGGVTMTGGTLSASGGQINLASVASLGAVSAVDFMPEDGMTMGKISLSQGALLDVSADAAGTVRIRGGEFVIDNATISADTDNADGALTAIDINVTGAVSLTTTSLSALTATTSGAGDAGGIVISSGSLNATIGTGSFDVSLIDSHTSGTGGGGDVTIGTGTGQLTVNGIPTAEGRNFITSGTGGEGDGGNVTITAGDIELTETTIDTGLNVFNGSGSGGALSITATSLVLDTVLMGTDSIGNKAGALNLDITGLFQATNNSFISSFGDLGENPVTVKADKVVLDNTFFLSGTVFVDGSDFNITARVVELSNGGIIASQTLGDGNAGNVYITASERVSLNGPNDSTPSGIFTSSIGDPDLGTLGNAGNIIIDTPRLELTNGGQINSTTFTSGEGGDVRIINANSVLITGERSTDIGQPFFAEGGTRASGIYTKTLGSDLCTITCGDAGDINITTGSLTLQNGGVIDSGTTNNGQGGNTTILATDQVLLSGTMTDGTPSGTFSRTIGTAPDSGPGGNIALTAGQSVTLSNGAAISTSSTGTGNAGNIQINTAALEATTGGQITSSSAIGESGETPTGSAGNVTIQGLASPADSVVISGLDENFNPSGIFTNTEGTGAGGNIVVDANNVMLQNGGTLSAKTTGTETTAIGGSITVNAYQINTDGATITVETTGAGQAGSIALITQPMPELTADAINLYNSLVTSSTSSNANAGDILIQTGTLLIENSQVSSDAIPLEGFTGGNAGTIHVQVGGDINLTNSFVSTSTSGNGNAGNILMAGNSLQAESSLLASIAVAPPGLSGGNGGTIQLNIVQDAYLSNSTIDSQTGANGNAGNVFVDATSLTLNSSSLSTGTSPGEGFTGGNAGDIQVTVGQLTMNDGLIVSQSLFSAGNGGLVTVNASESITTSGTGIFPFAMSTSTDGAAPFCPGYCGNAGSINVMAPTVRLNGVGLNSTTTGQGSAGNILANVGTLTVMNGAQISASAENPGVVTGAGGTVTITGLASPAQSVLIDGAGSGIFTETQGTGVGGNILIETSQSTTLTNGAAISASSTGTMDNAGDAGRVTIHAGNTFFMQDSSVTTQATNSGGGQIEINAANLFQLVHSIVSSSVLDGTGGGGDINIDPNLVVLQNNSQILARAIQGAGGNITIFTPLFLADSSSLVSASSQFGLNGTVTIQSPTSNLSGSLGPLASKTNQAQSLVTQRCAALVNGQASSFVVAGREQLPSDPGGWLSGPIAFAGIDVERFGDGAVAEGTSNLAPRTSGLLANDRVSLRRLTPARFLMANFAESEATGCHS